VTALSASELARLAGSTRDRVALLVEIGVLSHGEGERPFGPPDIQRVRLAEALDSSGISLESIGEAIAMGGLSFDFVDSLFPSPAALSSRTLEEVAEDLGVAPDVVTRLYAMWGLPRPRLHDPVREDDLDLFSDLQTSVPGQAFNEPTLIRGARILGESTRRIADAATWFFRDFFEQPALRSGLSRQEVIGMVGNVSGYMTPALERWVLWLLHRHFEHNLLQYIVEHVELVIAEAGIVQRKPTTPSAISFLDLTGYTSFTEEQGDESAAELAVGLAERVQEVSALYGGRPVKLLGDGVMFHFHEATSAVLCSFELIEQTARLGLPPARVGLSAGPVVLRDGDYFGRTVNVAARVADYARPREVLTTPEVRDASDVDAVEFSEIGPANLKGLGRVTLLLARRPRSGRG
jgi:adenylate cyclase